MKNGIYEEIISNNLIKNEILDILDILYEQINLDVFFVTLNKLEKDFSELTLYKDYAISDSLFHWQSQFIYLFGGNIVKIKVSPNIKKIFFRGGFSCNNIRGFQIKIESIFFEILGGLIWIWDLF